MLDQAAELRKLVLRAMRETAAQCGPAPRLVVVCGGREGVGVTTLALNLSLALAAQGVRLILIDADSQRSDIGRLCGLLPASSAAEIVARRRDIHELLIRGPGGIQLVPRLWGAGEGMAACEASLQRLLHQLQLLGRHAEMVVLDMGGSRGALGPFWKAADDLLLVTTPEPDSIMELYAAIKRGAAGRIADLQLVVNRAGSADEALDVYRRLAVSCRRFLGAELGARGWVPQDAEVPAAAQRQRPLLLGGRGPAAQAVERIAADLWPEGTVGLRPRHAA